jgi:hypothetical protein
MGLVPGFKSIVKSNSCSGGKLGNSSGNTFTNYCTTGRFSNPSALPFSFISKIVYNLHPLCIIF